MKRIKIHIPDMTSTHCQLRVKNALEALDGVEVHETVPGAVDVSYGGNQSPGSLTETIERAGYHPEKEASAGAENSLTFKTNINCSGCVAKVTPALDAAEGVIRWTVDTTGSDKLLSVETEGATAEQVMELVKKAGFRIEQRLS